MLRLRPLFGVTLLLTASAISCVVSVTHALQLPADYRNADVLADYEQRRLNALRRLLPAFTTVEYVDDHPLRGDGIWPTGYTTQYSLAPVIVVIDGGPQALVLVDGRPDVKPVLDAKRRLILVHDAGNGVR